MNLLLKILGRADAEKVLSLETIRISLPSPIQSKLPSFMLLKWRVSGSSTLGEYLHSETRNSFWHAHLLIRDSSQSLMPTESFVYNHFQLRSSDLIELWIFSSWVSFGKSILSKSMSLVSLRMNLKHFRNRTYWCEVHTYASGNWVGFPFHAMKSWDHQ